MRKDALGTAGRIRGRLQIGYLLGNNFICKEGSLGNLRSSWEEVNVQEEGGDKYERCEKKRKRWDLYP
jgi:hypothetical protein